jgi:hypothetical protein
MVPIVEACLVVVGSSKEYVRLSLDEQHAICRSEFSNLKSDIAPVHASPNNNVVIS